MATKATKAELESRLYEMFGAFDRLMLSHRDFTQGYASDIERAKRIERETEAVRNNLKR